MATKMKRRRTTPTQQSTSPDSKSENSPTESTGQAGSDATLEFMKRKKMPLTREVYLAMNYPDGLPRPWTAELEAELPEQFQQWQQLPVN